MSIFLAAVLTLVGALTGCENGGSGGDDGATIDPKVVGTWKVLSVWRWSEMTFRADGSKSQVDRISGEANDRGSWSVEGGKLIIVADVTEAWSYRVTGSTLTATSPGGTTVQMVRR
jgi:hypothetical protein